MFNTFSLSLLGKRMWWRVSVKGNCIFRNRTRLLIDTKWSDIGCMMIDLCWTDNWFGQRNLWRTKVHFRTSMHADTTIDQTVLLGVFKWTRSYIRLEAIVVVIDAIVVRSRGLKIVEFGCIQIGCFEGNVMIALVDWFGLYGFIWFVVIELNWFFLKVYDGGVGYCRWGSKLSLMVEIMRSTTDMKVLITHWWGLRILDSSKWLTDLVPHRLIDVLVSGWLKWV